MASSSPRVRCGTTNPRPSRTRSFASIRTRKSSRAGRSRRWRHRAQHGCHARWQSRDGQQPDKPGRNGSNQIEGREDLKSPYLPDDPQAFSGYVTRARGKPMHEGFEGDLRDLAGRGRLRALCGRVGVDFTSNDYLGLAESEELKRAAADAVARGVPAGSGGSRLLRGNHPEHEALEDEAAAYFGAETALYFGGGYVANFAIFSTLPQRGDLVEIRRGFVFER